MARHREGEGPGQRSLADDRLDLLPADRRSQRPVIRSSGAGVSGQARDDRRQDEQTADERADSDGQLRRAEAAGGPVVEGDELGAGGYVRKRQLGADLGFGRVVPSRLQKQSYQICKWIWYSVAER